MKLVMMAVFDSKVGAYATPFFARSKGEALRSFEDACRDEKLPFKSHPGDFSLYMVGEFDDNDGVVYPLKPLRMIGADEIGV